MDTGAVDMICCMYAVGFWIWQYFVCGTEREETARNVGGSTNTHGPMLPNSEVCEAPYQVSPSRYQIDVDKFLEIFISKLPENHRNRSRVQDHIIETDIALRRADLASRLMWQVQSGGGWKVQSAWSY